MRCWKLWSLFSIATLHAQTALAGMPSVSLSDFARMRFQTMSFFAVLILASALVVRVVWNSIGKDFQRLPRLSYRAALGVVVLWGLLFVVVLTMISGARELMTPGAWEKRGATYTLRANSEANEAKPATSAADDDSSLESERRDRLRVLYAELVKYASDHDGSFPAEDDRDAIDAETWHVPGAFGTKYMYRPGHTVDGPTDLLAFEPELHGGTRFVLLTNGDVRTATADEIRRTLAEEEQP